MKRPPTEAASLLLAISRLVAPRVSPPERALDSPAARLDTWHGTLGGTPTLKSMQIFPWRASMLFPGALPCCVIATQTKFAAVHPPGRDARYSCRIEVKRRH